MTEWQGLCIEITLICLMLPLWRIANGLQDLVQEIKNEVEKS